MSTVLVGSEETSRLASAFQGLEALETRDGLASLGAEQQLLTAWISLPGPPLSEFCAANLFPSNVLQSLIDHGIVYRVAHGTVAPEPMVRRRMETLFQDLPFTKRLHGTLAGRVRGLGRIVSKPERLGLLAHHFREAGDIREAGRAVMEFADFLKTYYRHREAMDLLRGILPLAREKELRGQLLEALRRASDRAGDQSVALESARQAAGLRSEPDVLRTLGYHAYQAGRFPEAERAYDRALVSASKPAMRALLLAQRAHVRLLQGRWEAAARDLKELEELRLPAGNNELLAWIHMAMGNHRFETRDFRDALRHYRMAVRLSRLRRGAVGLLKTLRTMALALAVSGDSSAANQACGLVRSLAESRRDRDTLAFLALVQGQMLYERGDLRKSVALFARGSAEYKNLGAPLRVAEATQNAGHVACEMGDWKEAARWSQEAMSICRRLGYHACRIRSESVMAQVLSRQGEFQKALDLIRQAETASSSLDDPLTAQFPLRARIDLYRELGLWDRVRKLSHEAEERSHRLKDIARVVEFRLRRAESLMRLGRTSAARSVLKTSSRLAGLANPAWSAEAMFMFLECNRLQGKPMGGRILEEAWNRIRTPRLRFRKFILAARMAKSVSVGMRFARMACKVVPVGYAGRDGMEACELAGDFHAQGGRRALARSHYGKALKSVEERLSRVPCEGRWGGDLPEMAARLKAKMERVQQPTTDVLEDLSTLDEMVRLGARSELVLEHVLKVLCRSIGATGAYVVRRARGRWKILASHGDRSGVAAEIASSGSRGNWVRLELAYRGDPAGLLLYRKPERPMGRTESTLVDILSARVSEVVHYEQRVIERLRGQSDAECGAIGASKPIRDGVMAGGIPEFAGVSPARGDVVSRALQAACTDLNVLIVGETGTGKEVLARGIHAASRRRRKPFVVVSCGALSSGLFESELFGHERGAFSGADRSHEGLIRAADGGTLFLDGVDELSPEVQAALLRVLELRMVRPVGAVKESPVDFRLVCASKRDLASLSRKGAFRLDLHHRLEGIVVRIPPLRERREDIPVLLDRFLQGRASFSPEALAVLTAHGWDGNVRELKNLVDAALARSDGRVDSALVREILCRPVETPASPRKLVEDAIAVSRTMSEAAQRLGCSRASLYRKLRRFGIASRRA